MSAPRLFGIPAGDAPVVAVLRRGPSDWSHVGRWEVERGVYEPGAWIKGNLYPQRCDLSPDGRWLCYLTLNAHADWAAGTTYVAVSRLPWLHALAAWGTDGTWSRGAHFVADPREHELVPPDAGDTRELTRRFGLVANRATTFAVERRRGWRETDDTPARAVDDLWDERRADRVVMRKPQPGDERGVHLSVRGYFAAFREGPTRREDPRETTYVLHDGERDTPLADVQWADWDRRGRLLVATTDGRLQIRNPTAGAFVVAHEVDLAEMRPVSIAAPPEARRW